MKPLDIYSLVKNLESNDIYTLLENRGIDIYHRPELFEFTKSDARILTDMFGNTSIFFRFCSGVNPLLENFILWHELGHVEIEGKTFQPRSYDISTFRKHNESDPNVFAFFGLALSRPELPNNPEEIAIQLGIPKVILENVFDRVYSDEEFMAYLKREK